MFHKDCFRNKQHYSYLILVLIKKTIKDPVNINANQSWLQNVYGLCVYHTHASQMKHIRAHYFFLPMHSILGL